MDSAIQAIELIRSDRKYDDANREICVQLLAEFLRREALWARKLGVTGEIPFADLTAAISKTDYSAPLQDAIRAFPASVAETQACTAMLRWYGWLAATSNTPEALDPPDPYPPLIRFFQLGGTFTREHRYYIDVNGLTALNASTVQSGDLSTPKLNLDE